MSMADILMKYGRPFWAAIGDENAARAAGASQIAADYLFGPEGTNAQDSFERGRREYKRELRNVRYETPFRAFLAELAGDTAAMGAGAYGAGKAFNMMEFLEDLKKPYAGVPKRTREQWQRDLQYGWERFRELRERGPLKRAGHPDAQVTNNTSWGKIRQGNRREKYDMLPEVPDIYATGKHHAQPRLKERTDEFEQFHWFQKGNRGIQIGESPKGRTLYNVNPDVRRYLLEHPDKAKLLGIDLTRL